MDEIKNRIVELCKKYKSEGILRFYDTVSNKIYDEFGLSYTPEAIRCASKRYRLSHNLDENYNPVVASEGSDDFGERETESSLLRKHGYDPNKFSVVRSRSSHWKAPNSSSITVKPKDTFTWTQETVDKILEGIRIEPDIRKYKQTHYEKNGKALVLPIADLHYDMRASIESSGNKYDTEIAKNMFFYIINDIADRIGDRKFEKIFFIIGNDMLNADNRMGTTTRGTPQDNCKDIENAIVEVTDMLIEAIDILKPIANVDVIHIPSNHDYMVSFGIANALRVRYSKDDKITVDCGFIERKYRKFGRILIGFAHDVKNVAKINDIIQADARNLMADTDETIYFLAHLHHEKYEDIAGTDVRRLPTISARSRWGYEQGYAARRKNQTFIVDSEFGIVDILYTIIK